MTGTLEEGSAISSASASDRRRFLHATSAQVFIFSPSAFLFSWTHSTSAYPPTQATNSFKSLHRHSTEKIAHTRMDAGGIWMKMKKAERRTSSKCHYIPSIQAFLSTYKIRNLIVHPHISTAKKRIPSSQQLPSVSNDGAFSKSIALRYSPCSNTKKKGI